MISNPSLKLSIQCPVHSVAWLTLSAVVSGGKQFLWGRIWSTTTYQVHWVSASKFVRAESQLSSSDTSLKCTCFFKHESYVLLIIKYNSMGFFSSIPPEAIPLLQKKFCLLQWAGYHKVMSSKKKAADWSSHTYYIFLYQMHEDINCKKVLMISSLKCQKTIWVFLVWRCLAKH